MVEDRRRVPSRGESDPGTPSVEEAQAGRDGSREAREPDPLTGRPAVILGEYRTAGHEVAINPAAIDDDDILKAVLVHELVHASTVNRPEAIDARIRETATKFGIDLIKEDYERWGDHELVADLGALEVLAVGGLVTAVKKYGRMRALRQELVQPFLQEAKRREEQKRDGGA